MEMQFNYIPRDNGESFDVFKRCSKPTFENDWYVLQYLFYAGDPHAFRMVYVDLFNYTSHVLVWQITSSRKGYDVTRDQGFGNLRMFCLFLVAIIWSDQKPYASKDAFTSAYSESAHRYYKHAFDAIRQHGFPFANGLYAAAFDTFPDTLKKVINTLVNER